MKIAAVNEGVLKLNFHPKMTASKARERERGKRTANDHTVGAAN